MDGKVNKFEEAKINNIHSGEGGSKIKCTHILENRLKIFFFLNKKILFSLENFLIEYRTQQLLSTNNILL